RAERRRAARRRLRRAPRAARAERSRRHGRRRPGALRVRRRRRRGRRHDHRLQGGAEARTLGERRRVRAGRGSARALPRARRTRVSYRTESPICRRFVVTLWIVLGAVGWAIGWISFVVSQKPDDAADGAVVAFYGLAMWPLFALGWVVSRPWSKSW